MSNMIESEPKTRLPSYWEDGELYMKNMLAYEAMQVFHYYGRTVSPEAIDADLQRTAVKLALQQADGFDRTGMLAPHVRVPFALNCDLVMPALALLQMRLDTYEDPEANGIPYRIRTYRDELARQHKKIKGNHDDGDDKDDDDDEDEGKGEG